MEYLQITVDTKESVMLVNASSLSGFSITEEDYREFKRWRDTILETCGLVDFSEDSIVMLSMGALHSEYCNAVNYRAVIKKMIQVYYYVQSQEIVDDSYLVDMILFCFKQKKGNIDRDFATIVNSNVRKKKDIRYE